MTRRVAVDAMGGDFAPDREVEAAVIAARRGIPVTLVGQQKAIGDILGRIEGGVPAELEILHAEDVIGMDEAPSQAVRRKRNASVRRAVQLVVEGGAGAMVSAGNSGAVMAAGLIDAGRIEGVQRPAIAGAFPTKRLTQTVVLDLGANIDPTPVQLAQFAVLGAAYAKAILGRERPKVAILCNGSEERKGSDLTRAAFEILERSSLDFVGYVEGNQLFDGEVDVIATDGFTGNVVLKSLEGFAAAVGDLFPEVKEKLGDPGAGAAPLLGLEQNILVAHGRSTVAVLAKAIQTAAKLVDTSVIHTVRELMTADAALWPKGSGKG